jgi:Rieske Fe-S protein
MSADATESTSEKSRRTVLNIGMAVLAAAAAAAVVGPGLRFLRTPPRRMDEQENGHIPTFDRKMFPPGEPVKVELTRDKHDGWNRVHDTKIGAAWVVALDDEIIAISTVCPHLGCAIDFDPESRKFTCPCHRSAFSLDGTVEFGPSPRPLDRLDVRIDEGRVAIKYQRFKLGGGQKEPT